VDDNTAYSSCNLAKDCQNLDYAPELAMTTITVGQMYGFKRIIAPIHTDSIYSTYQALDIGMEPVTDPGIIPPNSPIMMNDIAWTPNAQFFVLDLGKLIVQQEDEGDDDNACFPQDDQHGFSSYYYDYSN